MSAEGSCGRDVVTVYEGFLEKDNGVQYRHQVTQRVNGNEAGGSFLSFHFELPGSRSSCSSLSCVLTIDPLGPLISSFSLDLLVMAVL